MTWSIAIAADGVSPRQVADAVEDLAVATDRALALADDLGRAEGSLDGRRVEVLDEDGRTALSIAVRPGGL